MRTPSKNKREHILRILWDEFTGEKRFLILYQLWWNGIISERELCEALKFRSNNDMGNPDAYYFTLACFFLLYLDQEF